MIILEAIRLLHPQLIVDTSESFGRLAGDCATDRIEIAEIVKLPMFERFAFVMSVLEGYSDHECSLHLACTRAAVAAARVRALERIGRAAELRDKLVSIASAHKQQGTDSESAAQLGLWTSESSKHLNVNEDRLWLDVFAEDIAPNSSEYGTNH